MTHFESNSAGLKLIVAYKLVKATLTTVLAAVLIHEQRHGRILTLADRIGARLEDLHVIHGLGHAIAAWISAEVTPSTVNLAIGLIVLDTVSTSVEGVGLHYRQRWAAWLVVVATSCLIPLELWGLSHKVSVLRIAVLLINIAIVVYLVRRVLVRHRAEVSQPTPPA